MTMRWNGRRLAGLGGRLLTAGLLALGLEQAQAMLGAQAPTAAGVPELAGIWDGGGRARPVNSETVPWGKANFPELNERALAYQKVFEEIISPKYDCQPSTSPALQYDPYLKTTRSLSCWTSIM